jgi:uncharacterized protein YmfQ (DUF2313 family)
MSAGAADYQQALLLTAPPGKAYSTNPLSVWGRIVGAHADGFARIDAACDALLAEADPRQAAQMLPEWQYLTGVPEPGTGSGLTTAQLRAQVVAKVIAIGGQTVPYFTAIAAALGFTITISTYRVARIGAHIGDLMYGVDWAYAWLVTVTAAPTGFTVPPGPAPRGASAAPANVLEVFFHEYEPAIGALLFDYGDL